MRLRALTLAALCCLSTAVAASPRAAASPAERNCLAVTAWNEASGRPDVEVRAVMHVILNRARHDHYADTACGVVHQSGQFDLKPKARVALRKGTSSLRLESPLDVADLTRIKQLAASVHRTKDPTRGATHFYSPALHMLQRKTRDPGWARKLPRTVVIGKFVFHRIPKP